MLRLEGRLEGEPEEFDVRVHLLIRDLEGARLLRRDDRLSNLTGDLLGRAHGGIGDLTEDDHALSVAFALDRRPGPRQEVGLPFSREQAPLHEHRDLADRAVFERAEGHAFDVRREEDLPHGVADAGQVRGVAAPLLEPRSVRVVDVFEDLHDVEREDRGFLPAQRDGQEGLGTARREDGRPAERGRLDALPTVRERPVHELLDLRLEVRRAGGRLLRGHVRPGLMAHQGARRMEQEAVVDQITSLRFDADDRRVGRLMLAVVERPCVVDLEIEVHRPGLLRLQAELEGDLLVRLDLLDRPESDDLDGSADDRGDVLGRPVPLVRDVHLEPVPTVRLEPGVRRLKEQSRIAVLQESLHLRLRGDLGPLDEGLGPLQVFEAHRLFRLLQQRLDVGEVRVDGVCLRHDVPDPLHVGPRPVEDGPPALTGERFLRPPQVLVHLPRVLLLDRTLDLRKVRLRLADVQVLALRDRDVVDQGRELDLDLLGGDLALLPFEGFVEALLDLPDALVLAFAVRFFRLPQEELRLARVRADRLHLADRVAGRRQDLAHPVPQLGLDQVRLRSRLFDELPCELDVRLQGRLRLREEFVRLGRLGRAERVDRHGRQGDGALREGAQVGVRVLRDEDQLLDQFVDAFELVQKARPLLEDVPVSVLDLLQDLKHVQREQLRLLADHDRGEERVGRALDQDLGVPEVEAFHADARARLERVFHEVLHDREHAGEDVLVDLLAELAAVVRDEPSVGMDQKDVLDEVRRLRFDLDLLRVADLVTVLVEHPLVRDSDRDGDRACAFRPHADPHGDDLAYADLRDRGDALRLEVPGELDLDVPRREFPAVLDLDDVLVPLPSLEARGR